MTFSQIRILRLSKRGAKKRSKKNVNYYSYLFPPQFQLNITTTDTHRRRLISLSLCLSLLFLTMILQERKGADGQGGETERVA